MKRKWIGVIVVVLCAAALAAAYCVSRKRPEAPSSADVALYDEGGVRVGFGLHAWATSIRKAETSVVQGSDELYDVTVDDGRGAPMVIAFQASCCNGIEVQAVTDRAVTLRVMPGVGIGTSEFYVADRETREIRHYTLEGSYLATTSDGGRIVLRDNKGIVVQDAALTELRRVAWAPADEYVSIASTSPDDRHVAFLTWNGGHDESEKWHAYAYDLEGNRVSDLGPAVESARLRWKDGKTFVGVVGKPNDGISGEVERGTFTIPSP